MNVTMLRKTPLVALLALTILSVNVLVPDRVAAQIPFTLNATCGAFSADTISINIEVDTSDIPGATLRGISNSTSLPNLSSYGYDPGFSSLTSENHSGVVLFDFSAPFSSPSGDFTTTVVVYDASFVVIATETRTITCPTLAPTPTPTATATDTATATTTATATATATDTATATNTATATDTATATTTATATATATDTATATNTATATATATDTATATNTATKIPDPTSTLEPTATWTSEPASTSTPDPTSTATTAPEVAANDFAISLTVAQGSASGSFADHTTSSGPVTYGLVSTPQFGTVTFDPATGAFTYTLNSPIASNFAAAAIVENDSFTYSASVGDVTDTGIVSVAIDDGITPDASPVAPTATTVPPPVVSLPSTGSGTSSQLATYIVLLGVVGMIVIAGSLIIRQRTSRR